MKNVIIVLTFFGLWLSTQLNPVVQDYVAYALILTFGVLHGANDITLIKSLPSENQSNKYTLLRYIGAVAFVSILFLMSKSLALLFFILISGYHFGEQHFGNAMRSETRLALPFYLSYGLVVLFMVFALQLNEVVLIIEDIAGVTLSTSFFTFGLLSVAICFIGLGLFLYLKSHLKINPLKELFYLGVLALVFANASLVWGFAIYFIFWHSLPSLNDQLGFLYGKATKNTFLRYLKSSSIYWLASILGLTLMYLLLKDQVDFFITVVLYILAAITFPHVLVMSKVEALKK